MAEFIRRPTGELAQEVANSIGNQEKFSPGKGNIKKVVSTGSTLLDLAISGGVIKGGGIPAGIMVEIYGPSMSGKTSLLAEICASAVSRGGKIKILDPEGRLNREYCEKFNLKISDKDYDRPDTVKEVFQQLWDWEENSTGAIDVFACDSIAALSTEMEMEDEDKMGGKRAKDFSSGLRKTARIIAQNNRLVIFTNQVRDSMASFGLRETTPGGQAIKFYASLRIRIGIQEKLERKVKVVKEEKKIIGIKSEAYVAKSTVDEPYKTAPIYIVFNYGIDDIRANLQYLKDHSEATTFGIPGYPSFRSLHEAITAIEKDPKNIELLKSAVIDLWETIETKLQINRKPKVRF